MNIFKNLHTDFYNFLKNFYLLSENYINLINFDFNITETRKEFGSLSSNIALILAKELKKNPMFIAEEIKKNFTHQDIITIEIKTPGFINFFLSDAFYKENVDQLLKSYKQNNFIEKINNPLKYNIEFVSANPTGPLHIGHGRGGIIGDTLAKILKFIGHDVVSEFYINDAGNQIQKLGISILLRMKEFKGISIEFTEDLYQGDYIKEIAKQFLENDDLKNQENSEILGLFAKDILLEKIKETLALYKIHFDVYFSEKSLYDNHLIEKTIDYIAQKKNTYIQDDALFLKTMDYGDDKDRVLQKSDKSFTYAASDLAYLDNKINREFNKLIMILGQDHHGYVARLKSMLIALEYDPNRLDVILYQLVTLKSNGQEIRLSKRKGNIIELKDIIEEVGVDVARFFYLIKKADTHLDFDVALACEQSNNNPVYYIQYAYVRILSILKKASEFNIDFENKQSDYIYDLLESMIIRKISTLSDLLHNIGVNYQTHLLAVYSYDLAVLFHSLYSHNVCLDINNLDVSYARLKLIQLLKNNFDILFDLLGLSKINYM